MTCCVSGSSASLVSWDFLTIILFWNLWFLNLTSCFWCSASFMWSISYNSFMEMVREKFFEDLWIWTPSFVINSLCIKFQVGKSLLSEFWSCYLFILLASDDVIENSGIRLNLLLCFILNLLFKINCSWSIVDLLCCVSFYCTSKWISYTYTYTHSFVLDSYRSLQSIE